jgi:lysyl-tRNA synthetase, class II
MEPNISEYEQERREKLRKIRELGIDPFGGRVEGVRPLASVKAEHKPEFGQDGGPSVTIAGRIMLKSDMGKLSFIRLRDDSGDLQIALDKKRLTETEWGLRNLLDLGDQIVVEGKLGQTKTGEPTVWAAKVGMSAKALLPPPSKWDGLSDVELRYRQRYVDLWANPEVMQVAKRRIQVVDEIRRFLSSRGFLEVETPMLQTLHGGAAARPFVTQHKALDMGHATLHAHRAGTLPKAFAGRWLYESVRDQPELPK